MIRVLLLAFAVLAVVSYLPVEDTRPTAFADPAFARYYRRSNDKQQALLWGTGPLVSIVEPYAGAPGDRRLVQYFDRGRMELSSESATGSDDTITQGLLVRELATGSVQIGVDSFVQEDPAPIPLFPSKSTSSPDEALTYADFSGVVDEPAPDRTRTTDERFDEWIAPGGRITDGPPPVDVRAERFDAGHNIPDVTINWLETEPFGRFTPIEALGLPISEPFWTRSGLGPKGVSLVQLFERRVVVYTPDQPASEWFSLANVGRHYYRWRYGTEPAPNQTLRQRAIIPEQPETAGLTLPDGYRASIVRRDISDVFDIAVAPDGRIALGYADGSVTLIDVPNGRGKPDVRFVEYLDEPLEIAYAGPDLYALDASGLHRFRDGDTDGRVDHKQEIINRAFDADSSALVVGTDGSLYVAGAPASDIAIASGASARSGLIRIRPESPNPTEYISGVEPGSVRSLLVDDAGMLWIVDSSGSLARVNPMSGERDILLDATQIGGRVRDLLLYRSDGTNGDPYDDMIAVVTQPDGSNGRIVRLRPARSENPSAIGAGSSRSGTVVDFITGFDRPSAMVVALDGSLYVLDSGENALYRIQPE